MDMHAGAAVTSSRDEYSGSKAAAWGVFALTWLLMLFDFIDRQIVVSLLPMIKAEWHLSDTQLGGLISIVALTVGILAIPVAVLADRWSRVKCIVIMGSLWSVATIACSLASSYWQLLTLRAVVGVGESGYNAVGSAILASRFPARMRSVILAAFAAAATIGIVSGVLLGGILAKHYGWHAAFGIVGIPGLILALLYLFVSDYKTVAVTAEGGAKGGSLLGMARTLLQTPSAIVIYVASALQLFVVATIYAWLASYFNRVYSLPVDQAGIRAAILLLAGSLGGIAWGYLADRVSSDKSRNKIIVMAVSALSSAIVLPIAFGALSAGPAQFAMIMLGCACMTGTIGPVGAVAVDVVHPGIRAAALAVGVLLQTLLGQAAGPFFAGFISDRLGLASTLAVIPCMSLLAAVAFLLTLRWYDADLIKAKAQS